MSAYRDNFSVRSENLDRVYGVKELPGDTALRKGLDVVPPEELQALFKPQLDYLKSKGVIAKRRVLNKSNIVKWIMKLASRLFILHGLPMWK